MSPTNPIEPQISLRDVGKVYGDVRGVAPVSLDVAPGEFFSILGPSGCGKSTLLKLISGFETPSSGRIEIAGRDMTGVPPERRNIGFVFQSYALFPHMTVAENVAFGLEARGVKRERRAHRVQEVLELVELGGLAARRPTQLSGGQQQRVALARALAIEPEVLLLDEPFGALDRKLRESLQGKLVELQHRIGVTTVFVTHDQEEALTMSDRVAVMSVDGQCIEQVGRPRDIYQAPETGFVARFIGQTNWWVDSVREVDPGGWLISRGGFRLARRPMTPEAGSLLLSVRPERIAVTVDRPPGDVEGAMPLNVVEGRLRDCVFLGDAVVYIVETGLGKPLTAKQLDSGAAPVLATGQAVWLSWRADALIALPLEERDMKEDT